MAIARVTICKIVAVVVVGTLIQTLVKTTAAAASPTPMLPSMFANPTHAIAFGIIIQANARATTAAATEAAMGLVSRIVAIQADVPSSSPRTQTLIVSVLLMLVTIVLPKIKKNV